MKKFVPPALIVALLLTSLLVLPLSRTQAQAGLASSILAKMQKNQQTLRTLSADISMEKYNSQLRDSDQYSGTIKYIPVAGRSSFVRLEWTKPSHEILAIANGGYVLYRPRLGQAIIGTTDKIKSGKDNDVLALLNMSASQLRARFGDFQDTREETLWGGVRATHLKAVPKTAASYKYIEVWVDDSGMPVQTKMVEKNDDSTTVRLSNIAKNQNIDHKEFSIDLPSNVKKIKG